MAGWDICRAGRALLLAAGLLALGACGGSGVGTNGTGSPLLTGMNVGTVSGLGSIIVDGVRLDDSQARIDTSPLGTGTELAEAGLGQRVSLEFDTAADGTRTLRRVEVLPSVLGTVTAVTATTLSVMGQTVAVNTDPDKGPLTMFEAPLRALSGVKAGDLVEVHALGWSGADANLVATRIVRRAAIAGLRLAGSVQGLTLAGDGATGRFRLGGLTVQVDAGTQVEPAGAVLAEGQPVLVYAAPTALDATRQTLAASRVQITAQGQSGDAQHEQLRRTGLISGWNGRTFSIEGVTVRADFDTVVRTASGRTQPVADGLYVQVDAAFEAPAGWHVTNIVRPDTASGAELHGSAQDWTPAGGTFSVRGTPVLMAPGTTFSPVDCSFQVAAGSAYVSVTGAQTAQGVSAATVRCEAEPLGTAAPLARRGVPTAVDTVVRRLVLKVGKGAPDLAVTWDEQTYFGAPLSAAGLSAAADGAQVLDIEGSIDITGTQMRARKIKFRPL